MIVNLGSLPIHKNILQNAALVARKAGLLIFPTDTVYGIGCLYGNKSALERIYSLKKRLKDKPLAVLVSSCEEIKDLGGEISPLAQKLVERFWPGPLTLVISTKNKESLGVRIPNHALALPLLKLTGPLSTTSANLSTQQSVWRFADIPEELLAPVDMAIDGGDCPLGVESTVIDTRRQGLAFLREGYIKKADVEKVLGKENVQ